MTVRHYYATALLPSNKQINAADLLLGLLLLRQRLKGQNYVYFANLWNVTYARVNGNSQRARGALYSFMAGAPWPEDPQRVSPMLTLEAIRADYRKHALAMDAMEAKLCEELSDARTEALIRQMFNDDCNGAFLRQRPKRLPRAATHAPRAPGRPAGAKNKPKLPDQNESGWLMPDGTRI